MQSTPTVCSAPPGRVDLPDLCEVEFEPRSVVPASPVPPGLAAAYAILSERYASGEADVAARHNEHQP